MPSALAERKPQDQEKEKTPQELILDLRIMKEEHEATGATPYPTIIREIGEWAMGITNEKRLQLYPSWTDQHFQKVLDALGEDWLSGI